MTHPHFLWRKGAFILTKINKKKNERKKENLNNCVNNILKERKNELNWETVVLMLN